MVGETSGQFDDTEQSEEAGEKTDKLDETNKIESESRKKRLETRISPGNMMLLGGKFERVKKYFLEGTKNLFLRGRILPSSAKPQPQLQLGGLSWLYFHVYW